MQKPRKQRNFKITPLVALSFIIGSLACNKTLDKPVEKPATTSSQRAIESGIRITEFGAVGDGKTENYDAFQAAGAYASSHPNTTIIFPAGTYYIGKYRSKKNDPIDHIYWKNCKGLKIIGEDGAKISVNGDFFRPYDYSVISANGGRKSYTSGLSPFWFYWCDDVLIKNLEITGNVQDTKRVSGKDANNPSVTESNNILLRFTKCNNVTIDKMYLHHAESDGIAISGDRVNGVWINSTNFTVTNLKSYNNGRQGMSVGGLTGGYFRNCEFKYSGFTGGYGHNDPAAGVDIEPGEFHYVKNMKFENCVFENNYGGQFICSAPTTTSNLTLYKCTVLTGIETPKLQGVTVLAKNVLINTCVMKIGKRSVKLTNPDKPGSTVRIVNSIIESSYNGIYTRSQNKADSIILYNNKFTYTGNSLTSNFLNLQTKNLQFVNNKVFIPAAALKSRPTGTHVLVQNAIISKGNTYYSENPTIKPKVSYTGTKIVAD